jgi:hypothetical protein
VLLLLRGWKLLQQQLLLGWQQWLRAVTAAGSSTGVRPLVTMNSSRQQLSLSQQRDLPQVSGAAAAVRLESSGNGSSTSVKVAAAAAGHLCQPVSGSYRRGSDASKQKQRQLLQQQKLLLRAAAGAAVAAAGAHQQQGTHPAPLHPAEQQQQDLALAHVAISW